MKFWKAFSALCGGLAGFLFGELDGLMIALIVFIILDYITGVLAAAKSKRLNSAVGFRGIAKKIVIFVIVAVANVLETQVFKTNSAVLRSMVIGFYLANEGLSITENAGKLGLPLPKKLKDVLEQLRDKDGDAD